jgi:cysteine desulfurase
MMPYFRIQYGNAASRSHAFGWKAAEAVDIARHQIASLLEVDDEDIYFNSGATEGLNTLIKGTAEALIRKGKHIITWMTEHHAVLDVMEALEKKGYLISRLPVMPDGRIDFENFQSSIRPDTIFVVAMWANNETGVIHEVSTLSRWCQQADLPLICDATQAVGKIPVHPRQAGIDMMAFSGHKLYGPKGVGAIYINPALRSKLPPLIHGGGHERNIRSGTLNVPAIAGFGQACQLAGERMDSDINLIGQLRDHFEKRVSAELEEIKINGHSNHRLHTVSNLLIRYTDSQAVMSSFRSRLAISSGSACSSANAAPSHVLLSMGLSDAEAKASYRISLGRMTTLQDIKTASEILIKAVMEYRSQSPIWDMFKKGIDVDGLSL